MNHHRKIKAIVELCNAQIGRKLVADFVMQVRSLPRPAGRFAAGETGRSCGRESSQQGRRTEPRYEASCPLSDRRADSFLESASARPKIRCCVERRHHFLPPRFPILPCSHCAEAWISIVDRVLVSAPSPEHMRLCFWLSERTIKISSQNRPKRETFSSDVFIGQTSRSNHSSHFH